MKLSSGESARTRFLRLLVPPSLSVPYRGQTRGMVPRCLRDSTRIIKIDGDSKCCRVHVNQLASRALVTQPTPSRPPPPFFPSSFRRTRFCDRLGLGIVRIFLRRYKVYIVDIRCRRLAKTKRSLRLVWHFFLLFLSFFFLF